MSLELTDMSFETTTSRLRLRRPDEADRAFHTEVHSDPRLYTHAPHVLGTPETNRAFYDAILAHWEEHGFGYWVAEDLQTGMPLGWVGVKQQEGYLNLYYRFTSEAQGRGFAREAGRAAVAMATEWQSDAVAGALRDPDGALVGWAWWVRTANPLLHHGCWLYRVMVDPSRQGRGLGLVLMAGMHRIAREDGVELPQLGVRSGWGASEFYARCAPTAASSHLLPGTGVEPPTEPGPPGWPCPTSSTGG